MSKFIDLTGQTFSYLYVQCYIGNGKYKCVCIGCGKEKHVRGCDLKSEKVKSCGRSWLCIAAKILKKNSATTHGLSSSFEYIHLNGMIQRCYNPNNQMYKYYGALGITVYQEWRDNPQTFKDYLHSGQMPETLEEFKARCRGKTATIDRIDTKGNYEPLNIRWATMQEQNQNRGDFNVLNEEMVKFIKIEIKNGKTEYEIFEFLKINYNYLGHINTIGDVIKGKSWTNIK